MSECNCLAYFNPQAPIFKPPSKAQYHSRHDATSGECLKDYYEDILLVIVYHFPLYDTIPLLKAFYKDAFKDILICGPESFYHHYVMVVDVGPGLYGYECAGEAIRRYSDLAIFHKESHLYLCNNYVTNTFWQYEPFSH